MDDLISRQDAISLIKKWSGGYEYIETETESAIKELCEMPSAQPEITRCKDCGYYDPADNDEESDWCHAWGETTEENAFCSYAKRRTDEQTD